MVNYAIKQDARGIFYEVNTPVVARGPGGQFVAYNINMMNAAQMAWADLESRLREREAHIFEKGQAKWPDLDPKYKAWKARHGLSTKKLIATGDLYRSLTQRTNLSINDMSRFRAGFKVKFGTKRRYAYKHQYGVDVPQREFLDLMSARYDAPYFISRFNLYYSQLQARTGGPAPSAVRGTTGAGAYSSGAALMGGDFLSSYLMSMGMINPLLGL